MQDMLHKYTTRAHRSYDGRRKSFDNWHYWNYELAPNLGQKLRRPAPGKVRQQHQQDATMPRAALAFRLLLMAVIPSQIPERGILTRRHMTAGGNPVTTGSTGTLHLRRTCARTCAILRRAGRGDNASKTRQCLQRRCLFLRLLILVVPIQIT